MIVKNPTSNDSKSSNDYGSAFYCTHDLVSAHEWACRNKSVGYVNEYELNINNLKILDLTDKDKYSVLNWVAILLHFRNLDKSFVRSFSKRLEYIANNYYIDVKEYDLVIGYRADDAYFRFPRMFIEGVLTYEKLEEIYLEGNLGKQYVLKSEKAFSRIHYVGYIEAEAFYKERYELRKNNANRHYTELELAQRKAKGKRIRDLIEDDRE